MFKFYPSMYKENIYDINYNLLKQKNIKCLAFDLDNTIALIDQDYVDSRTKTLFKELKKDFKIYIVSNNSNKNRVGKYANILDCDFMYFSLKPSIKALKKIKKINSLNNCEIAVIGDQLVTDIYMANRFKSFSILVDPLGVKDLKITGLNRYIENKILKKYNKKQIFSKGDYYE